MPKLTPVVSRFAGFANSDWPTRLVTIQFYLLCLLVLAMPNFRELKSIALGLLFLSSLIERPSVIGQSFARPEPVEWMLLSMLVISGLSAWLSTSRAFRGTEDTFAQIFLFWFMYRHNMTDPRRQVLSMFVVYGIAIGLAIGTWQVLVAPQAHSELTLPEMKINRAAQYLGIGVCVATALLIASAARAKEWWRKAVQVVLALWLTFGMWMLGSRGAIAGVVLAVCMAFLRLRYRRFLAGAVVVVAGAILLVQALPARLYQNRVLEKLTTLFAGELSTSDQTRIAIWKSALDHIATGKHFLFGVGPGKFEVIGANMLFSNEPAGHAHNWILNKLVEEGLLGLIAFVVFIGWIVVGLLRKRTSNWLWMAALGALLVPLIAGLFAGKWVKENAFLAMIILGMWAGSQRHVPTSDQRR